MLDSLLSFLIDAKLIPPIVLQTLPHTATQSAYHLFDYLIDHHALCSNALCISLAERYSLTVVDLTQLSSHTFPHLACGICLVNYHLLPLVKKANLLCIATCYPCSTELQSLLRFQTGCELEIKLVDFKQLKMHLHHYQAMPLMTAQMESAIQQLPIENKQSHNAIPADEPLVQFVDTLLMDAHRQQVSDIHIEPMHAQARIRFRRDGILRETLAIPLALYSRIISRLKIMAHLDIAEKRLPQDGRIQTDKLAVRINTCPIIYGEKAVLRLQHLSAENCQLSNLQLLGIQEKLLLEIIQQPQGLILATGPTGSGKTQTLYAILNFLNTQSRNCYSVEDPVEIALQGVNQVNIQPSIGFNFAEALRAFLRQDPDIIMLGEIRDAESARIAFLAAQTGHLVLATLHTNSAQETANRLQGLGIDTSHASGLSLIINQRLIRKLCSSCKAEHQRCDQCQDGYDGRIGIYELCALQRDYDQPSLWQAASAHITAGLTNICEVKRVLGKLAHV